MTQAEKYERITNEPIYPLLWRMALPSMAGMMVSSVYSAADTYFIGKLGRTELTASVGLVFSFISIVQAVGFWFGYGAGNYVSRQIGRQNAREADKMTSIGVGLAVSVGLIVTALGLVFIRPLAVLLGAGGSEELMNSTVSYLRITLVTVPVMLTANVLYNVLRLQGSAKDSVAGLLAGMLLNIALDPLFILCFDMGVAGAALASLAGQVSGTVILFSRMGKNGNTSVKLSAAVPKGQYVKVILAGGAPNFCRQGISSISTVLLNHIAGGFGAAAIAAMTISTRIISMGYALVIGFGQGFQPICAINYGAEKYDRVKTAFRYALLTATGFLVTAAVLFAIKAEGMIKLFSGEKGVLEIGTDILRAECVSLPFMGYYILIGMFLQNIGRFREATFVTVAQNGTFLIPMTVILPAVFGYGGLVWCKTAAGVCALILSYIIGSKIMKKEL